MLVAERRREIVRLVDQKNSIRVTELAKLFAVTEETIRRDLESLEEQGKLLRSHGGAVTVKHLEKETPFHEREITNESEKMLIASEAVRQVEEDDTILLDASTTAWQMARLLPDMRLTVLTNAIKVAVELADRPQIRVISTGGTLTSASLSYVGPLAERSLEGYFVNKLFFSCKGVDPRYGLSDSNEWQAMLKRRMISIADRCYFLADHSKFGSKALTVFAQLNDIDEVITDNKIDEKMINILNSKGVTVKIAE
ncbi:DeoR/GlpR family DNA-binding transcription regulator [Scopulibacillus cellulosilyticus]|uniref:DeoR/GlpR family DNA-binding transcription regulator n=1 Tax=Scopulibacillus cellulosilyticus TaxID=2665665 RepID=A0ABW2Q3B5_9BACL